MTGLVIGGMYWLDLTDPISFGRPKIDSCGFRCSVHRLNVWLHGRLPFDKLLNDLDAEPYYVPYSFWQIWN